MEKIEVVKSNCPQCGSAVFLRKGKVMADGIKKYTREICKAGCGYVGSTVLEDGSIVGKQPVEEKE